MLALGYRSYCPVDPHPLLERGVAAARRVIAILAQDQKIDAPILGVRLLGGGGRAAR